MGVHSPHARLRVVAALALSSVLCLAMLIARPAVVGHPAHAYLAWNLFLAWLPFVVALVVYDRAKRVRGGSGQLTLLSAWLLFLPSAPYIVTDLVHLPSIAEPPLWFDAVTYVAFAWTGLVLGLVSLYLVHCAVRATYGARWGWAAVGASVALSGLGIYLGRFLRWNSWDIVTDPGGLAGDLLAIARDPLGKPLGITLLFAAFVGITYLGMYAIAELRSDSSRPS